MGEAFEYDVLHDFLEQVLGDSPRVERAIEGLVEANLLQEPPAGRGDRLHFVHPVVRVEMLTLMENDDRVAAFHEAAAATLKAKFAGHEAEVAQRLATHLQGSGQLAEAARYLLMAAQRSRHDGNWLTARDHLEAAERALHADSSAGTDRARAEIWLELASAEIRTNNLERAQSLAARVYRWAAEHDRPLSGRAMMVLGDCLRRLGRLSDAARGYEKAVDIFRTISDEHAVARGLLGQLLVAKEQGNYTHALAIAPPAETTLNRKHDLRGLQQLARCVGECRLALGDIEIAVERFREARKYAHDSGDIPGWSSISLLLARALQRLGRGSDAHRLVLEIIAAETKGVPPKAMFNAYRWLGDYAVSRANHEAAFTHWHRPWGGVYRKRSNLPANPV